MSRQKKQKAINDSGVTVSDSYANLVANLGTSRDKSASGIYVDSSLSAEQLSTMYANSWVAAAIIDYPAEDATRNWRNWKAETDQINKIEAIEKRLDLRSKVKEARQAAGLFGGSAIYINTDSEDGSSPLKQTENIKSLVVLSKDQITSGEVVRDINSEYYGRPEFYLISSKDVQVSVHASRFAIFHGKKIPGSSIMSYSNSWGESNLKSTLDAINQANSTLANIASLVFEAKIDVFKLKGLAQMLADKTCNGAGVLTNRLTLQAAMKGINGALVLDGEDQYEQKNASFSSLDAIADLFLKVLAGASKIPVSRLFGREASGLSGNGEGDERTYYDRIKDIQTDDISPAIRLIDDCIINEALGSRPLDIYYEWAPLRNKTEHDNADILSKIATAARTLAGTQAGSILPLDALSDAVANTIIESGSMPGLEQAIEKYGNTAEQNNLVGGEDEI